MVYIHFIFAFNVQILSPQRNSLNRWYYKGLRPRTRYPSGKRMNKNGINQPSHRALRNHLVRDI